MRTENERAIARVQERFAEELLEDLGTGTDNDVLRFGGDVKLFPDKTSGRLAEFGNPWGGAIVRLIVSNGLLTRLFRVGRAGERAVTNFEFDDILTFRLQLLGDRQDGKRGFDVEILCELTERDGHLWIPRTSLCEGSILEKAAMNATVERNAALR